jgi:hypothetical protein
MPRIASQGELVDHTTTSGDGGTLTKTAGSEAERVSATPAHAYTPDSQEDDFQSIAERCAVYLHQEILRGDPLDENILAGWPDKMEFLLRETGFPEDKFKEFMVFVFREQINDEEHDHLNSVLWLNWAKDPAASLKKNAEMLAHRYGAYLKAKEIKASLSRK